MENVTKVSDEDVSHLRHTPVTAARHFQYHLNTFFQVLVLLKSSAHPIGDLVAIRIEFQAR